MSFFDRPYQHELEANVYTEWRRGARNVVMRLDTGGGKTVILSRIILKHIGYSCVIAHRDVLVGQISIALARCGVPHNIIASADTLRLIAMEHVELTGRSWISPNATCTVASVDTLIRRENLAAWASKVTLWIVDEGHHVTRDNKWNRALMLFNNPACNGLLPTATPARPDGKGLGRWADGLADSMVEGPPMRWLIDEGYLCDYDLICPRSDLEITAEVGASGDWSPKVIREATKRSHIVGDMVETYLEYGAGLIGATFTSDVETADEICREYISKGVPAAMITGNTEGGLRRQIIRQLERRQLKQLVAVDVVSEGFDLPALEWGTLGRKSMSYIIYAQQFGRFLRPVYADGYDLATRIGRLSAIGASHKPRARLSDHVGNTIQHAGPPDKPRVWSLDRRDKRAKSATDEIGYRACVACLKAFEKTLIACPHCGEPIPPPAARATPQQVEGDMFLMDPAELAILRGQKIDLTKGAGDYSLELFGRGVPRMGHNGAQRVLAANQEAQRTLRDAMAIWGGIRAASGRNDREIQREFYMRFNVDVESAQCLDAKAAQILEERIRASWST